MRITVDNVLDYLASGIRYAEILADFPNLEAEDVRAALAFKFAAISRPRNDTMDRITIDPAICHGKPCIRGLRYPVELILDLLSSGMTTEQVLADYDDLEREDILAVLAFAARLSRVKRIESAAA
jgi:uncharacterized protein (DUF433 family)